MAGGVKEFSSGLHGPEHAVSVENNKIKRRPSYVPRNMMDADGLGSVCSANLGGGLCPTVNVF